MRKFTLFLCTLFASIGMIQAAPNTPPETSTSYSDAKTYIIVSYRGGSATNPFLISASETQLTGTTSKPESINNLLWFFVPANDNGGVYMCNWGLSSADSYAAVSTTPLNNDDSSGKKMESCSPTDLASSAQVKYFLSNNVNEYGLVISKNNPISGNCCLDQSGSGFSNGWRPASTDWNGTTFNFVEVASTATPDEVWAAAQGGYANTRVAETKNNALAILDNLKTLLPDCQDLVSSDTYNTQIEEAKGSINNYQFPAGGSLTDAQNTINGYVSSVVNNIEDGLTQAAIGKIFTLKSSNRDGQYLVIDGSSVNTSSELTGNSLWTAVQYNISGVSGFSFQSKVSGQAMSFPSGSSEEDYVTMVSPLASVFRFKINTSNPVSLAVCATLASGRCLWVNNGTSPAATNSSASNVGCSWTINEVSEDEAQVLIAKSKAVSIL